MPQLGQAVKFAYRGSFPDGEVFDESQAPYEIILGRGRVMPAMEQALCDMEIGEERTLELDAKDAYGEYNDGAVQRVPTWKIPNGENIPVGRYIAWRTPRSIEPVPAKVLSVENSIITLDFNHPLAGKDIVYDLKLIDVDEEVHPL